MWRGDGKELYYLTVAGEMMAVTVRTGPKGVEADTPHRLFARGLYRGADRSYAVTADGQKFLAFIRHDIVIDSLTIVTKLSGGVEEAASVLAKLPGS